VSKTILITGTSKGIGNFLKNYYLDKGCFVIGCSRSKDHTDHKSYKHFPIDLAIENEILSMFKWIRKEHGRLDVVINNAAVNPAISFAALIPTKVLAEAYAINFIAPTIINREAIKLMGKKKFGRIINMGSMAAKHEVAGETVYTSNKAALSAYSRVLAKEVYKLGISVNVVAPSAIKTDLSNKINQEALAEVLKRNAIPEYGVFEDVSNTIDWLIKEESNAITGQIIYLGGV